MNVLIDIYEIQSELDNLEDWALIDEIEDCKEQLDDMEDDITIHDFYNKIDKILQFYQKYEKLNKKDRKVLEASYILLYTDLKGIPSD